MKELQYKCVIDLSSTLKTAALSLLDDVRRLLIHLRVIQEPLVPTTPSVTTGIYGSSDITLLRVVTSFYIGAMLTSVLRTKF